jgi:hypothetical protein
MTLELVSISFNRRYVSTFLSKKWWYLGRHGSIG